MSSNQANNKKSGSSNSSMVNTPASTPVTTMANGQNTTQTSPPPNNNAPKYGTLVPNRIFVGGISANTTEGELHQLFSNYGTVKAAKIIQDRAGVSKGYGFITFENEDDAKRLQREADNIVLRERKLNIAPAIKKQPFSRAFDAASPPAVAPGNPAQYFFQPGAMPYFQGGVAYYPQPPTGPTDPAAQPPAVYQTPSVYPTQTAPAQTAAYPPVMFPAPQIYMPQQYPMPMPYEYNYYPNGGVQYMVGGQGGPSQSSQVPPLQRPNSPPRPPCYAAQQLPYNAPTDPVYYTMPIYGSIDGAIYADPSTMDMSMSNGTLSEDVIQSQQTNEIQSANDMQQKSGNLVDTTPQTVTTKQQIDGSQTDVTLNRQSNTPVVSLLMLEHHQEKDVTSMQSGRRRKITSQPQSTPPPPPQQQQQPPPPSTNGYAYPLEFNNAPSFLHHHHHPAFVPPPPPNYTFPFVQPTSKTPPMLQNGVIDASKPGSNNKKWRRCVETSSLSSIRTDSNSSASVVDENRNEEKSSSVAKTFTSRNYTSHRANGAGGGGAKVQRGGGMYTNRMQHPNLATSRCQFHAYKQPANPLQMHPNQHFIPPSRTRGRRTVRRNGTSSLSEIGAGDAPLPNPDVAEACNKLDSLKL